MFFTKIHHTRLSNIHDNLLIVLSLHLSCLSTIRKIILGPFEEVETDPIHCKPEIKNNNIIDIHFNVNRCIRYITYLHSITLTINHT